MVSGLRIWCWQRRDAGEVPPRGVLAFDGTVCKTAVSTTSGTGRQSVWIRRRTTGMRPHEKPPRREFADVVARAINEKLIRVSP